MTFNIHDQSAGVINNVAGDQHIAGGQSGTVVTAAQAGEALQALGSGLAGVPLDDATAVEARAELDEIDAQMHVEQPDARSIAGHLDRLTRLLAGAGALATAGAALVTPLETLATWLGAAGQPVLALLQTLL